MTHQTNWNLKLLFEDDNDPKIVESREESKRIAYEFVQKWQSRTDYLENPEILKTALDEYETFLQSFGDNEKELYYYHLKSSLDQNSADIKAKLNSAQNEAIAISNQMQFFSLRIAKISEDKQKTFLEYEGLKPYKHYLEQLFKSAKHQLSEPEEKIATLMAPMAYSNWVRMVSGFITKESGEIKTDEGKKEKKLFEELLKLCESKKKEVRDNAKEELLAIFEKHIESAENEINSVLQLKKVDDELRGFDRPDQSRHLSDDMETEVVDTVVKSVTQAFPIARRYYSLRAKLMKQSKIGYHERNVPLGNLDKKFLYEDATQLVSNVFKSLDQEFFAIFDDYDTNGKIDVFPKPGKKGGAFCTHNMLTLPGYVLLNHTDTLNDVLTIAHEMGHAINNELMRKSQNALNFGAPTSTAEVASTFMEDFVLQELSKEIDEETQFALLMMKLNDEIQTIFRQIAFYNFEKELHAVFRNTGYVSKEEIGKIFVKHIASYMGDSVDMKDVDNWWIYVSHFRYYFYVYTYSSGLLISKSLQAKVKENPKFIEDVKEFLAAGSSDSPKNLFMKLGIDITKPEFWDEGLKEVEKLLNKAEELAKRLGKI